MASENKLQEVIAATLSQVKNIIDADTVIGSPIQTASGTTIIPISKVAVGYATGGIDFNDKSEKAKPQNFGAGGGTGISIQPVGFLCISADGKTEMVNIGLKNPSDPIEQISEILDRSPEIIAKIKALFAKDNSEDEAN
ncbi:MAG: sporulation protein YtfJ [Ruminococcaceae bacterium]|nr:sporulation protein YtfJ [Oscillospiraceae bacterium]